MRLSLMAHAIKRVIWLVGFALMLVTFGLQATALRFGELSVVQPVLTTELLFLLLILGGWFRYRLGWQEWTGALVIVAGLGGFFLAAAPSGGNAIPSNHAWWIASVILLGTIAAFIVSAMRGPRWWRAAAFGAATAVTAAYTAALTKAITSYTKEGWGHVFTHFQPYMLAITGLGTVFLIQNALHAGPITASRTTMVTINPLVSIVLGLTLFADRLRSGPLWVSLEILALAVLVAGVVILARSPLVAGTPGTTTPGRCSAADAEPPTPLRSKKGSRWRRPPTPSMGCLWPEARSTDRSAPGPTPAGASSPRRPTAGGGARPGEPWTGRASVHRRPSAAGRRSRG